MTATKPKITAARPAGVAHQVLTIEGGSGRTYRRQPCATCPWRVDAVGEFPAEAFRHSANTAEDMAAHSFGCHTSGAKKPAVCAGFLLRNSDNNMAMRLMAMRGDLDYAAVHDGGVELHDSYRTMAVANGVAPDDPALDRCRANYE